MKVENKSLEQKDYGPRQIPHYDLGDQQRALDRARKSSLNGNFNEAFDIYDQLALAYPEKAIVILAEVYDKYQLIPERDRYLCYQSRFFNFGIKPTDKVLDIGSGNFPFHLATHLADIAIDDDDYGRGGVPFKHIEGKPVFECNIENLPFKDKEFDFVYCSHVLEHAVNPERACNELMRVAKRGYIETPTPSKDLWLNNAKVSHHRWAVENINGKLVFTEYSKEEIDGLQHNILRRITTDPQTQREKAFSSLIHLKATLFNTMLLWEDSFEYEIRTLTRQQEVRSPVTSCGFNAISNITSIEPRFSFVMIVLNGMPFIEYSIKSVYDFAHEIIIVEGAVETCIFAANPDGSSTDGTVEFIKSFPDTQNKIKLIQGKWPEKCEMQNEALKYVTGDYVWLIDSDEVYKHNDLLRIKQILSDDRSITQVNFIPDNFWKGLDYIFVSHEFFKRWCHYRRLFKYVPGAIFTTHRPPTMVWPGSDKTTEQMRLVDGHKTRKMGIVPYHYSYVLNKQVKQKVELYTRYKWGDKWGIDLLEWYNECFLKWTPENRVQIEARYPVWTGDRSSRTQLFTGTHPEVMENFKNKQGQKHWCSEEQALQVIGDTYYQKKVVEAWNLIEIDEPVIKRKNLMTQNIQQNKPFWNIHVALAFLAERLNPENYLEVGVRTGCSLVPLLHNSDVKEVVALDMWEGSYAGFSNTNEYTVEQINKYKAKTNKRAKIEFIKGDSHKKLKDLINSGRKFDLITVDGDHTESGAWEDLQDAAKLLADKGAIVFDDIIHPSCLNLQSLVNRLQAEHPEYSILINTKQDTGCAIFLKNIDIATLLNEKLLEVPGKRNKQVRVAGDYIQTGVKVDAESSFGTRIQELFTKIRPRKIIETGTYLGTGTTTIITRSLQRLGIDDAMFFTIEVNPQNYVRAKQYFETNNMKVNALNGLSVPRAMLPSREEIARKTITDVDYDGIFVDHKEENRAELYYNETNFPNLPDDLLYKCLKVFDFKPDFVLLDSGGHMGNIEFNHLIDNLQGECYIALDDIYHVKHHHSFQQIQEDERLELIVHSKEKFGFCIVKFTSKYEQLGTTKHLPVNENKFETKNVKKNQIAQARPLLDQGHIIKALKEFEEILALSPDTVDAHLGRALCLARLGRLLEAEVEAKNALSKDPNNPRLLQFAEQMRKIKPNLTGDRDIEWGSIKNRIKEIAKIQGQGAKLLDFGCGQTAELSRIATQLGYQITAIDMMPLTVSLDSTQNIHFIQGEFLHQDWTPQSFDLIINCSSIEHSGLVGRYGVVEEGPDDDLKIMARMNRLIKPDGKMLLTIPVGLDKVVGSLHRVYGQTRLAKLLDGWEVQSNCFWIKDENNQWREVDEESALQREPMLAYGLGCFVLRPAVRVTSPSDSTLAPIYAQRTSIFDHSENKTTVNVTASETSVSATYAQPHKVLIVRTDGIGDFVIFSGSLPYYRKLYPSSHISIVVRECSTELADACPYIDEVIVNHRKSMVYDQNHAAEFINRIRAAKFDVVICPIYSRDKVSDFIVINSGAEEKIVSTGNDSNMPLEQIKANNPYFTKLVPAKAGTMLEVERNKEFLEGLGVITEQPYKTTVWMEQEHKDFADRLLKELNIEKPLVICPFAQYQIRDWPDYKWAQLISCWRDYPVLICGSQQNTQSAENIIKATEHPRVHNLCGKTSLRQLAALLYRAKLCVGLESAPAHIAAAVDCPHVVIIGGGHFGRFMPYSSKTTLVYNQMDCYGCNWRCKYGQDTRCIKAITVDMVEQVVSGLLKRAVGPSTQNLKTDYKQAEKKQYLVSAIISTYNSEKFIRGCLNDLERQTISDRLEVIIVNSGSQQNEEAIVREFQQKYDNIKYIKTEQRETIYKAWNRGIKAASGKYITNANTDDRHRQDALEIMARALDENPDKALVYADQLEINEIDGRRVTVGERVNGEFSRSRLFNGECPPSSQPMWRKDVHDVYGYFDEGFMISGDYEFWFRLTQKFGFLYLNDALGERFLGTEAVSQANDDLLSWENEMVIRKCYEYALQEGMTIGATGISEHPIFSRWPEANIWKQKVKAKLTGEQISRTDCTKDIWDYRTNPAPKLTIVIVTYNRRTELLENLNALNEQNEKDFEVIVMDNGGDLSWLKQHKDKFNFGLCGIELGFNFGPSPARNIGTDFAKAEYVAFLDDDAVADKDLVRNILEHFENYSICGLRGEVLPKTQTDLQSIPVNYDMGDQIITTACEVSCLSAFRKDVLVEMGGFDELLFGSEGIELSYRICKAQKEKVKSILYFPDVIVYHDHCPEGPVQTEKIMRQRWMALLAWRKDNEITGYKELVHSLYPGNKAVFENNYNNYTWILNVAIYLQRNFPEEAVECAEKAVALRPDGFKGCYFLGSLYTWFGRYDEALALLERIYEPLRNSAMNGGSEFISSEFKDQVDIRECYASMCTKLAQCYMQTNQYQKLKQVYTDLLNIPNLTLTEEQKANILNVLTKLDRTPPTPIIAEKKNNTVVSAKSEQDYLVSAIVSTYNSEKFLRGCLEDLEQQTIADKLEIIVINSGSQENEETIVHEYQQKHNNIVYIKTEQREGIYTAWNRAIKVARGTFLTNANTDDRHREDVLEIMSETLLTNPDIALVYGDQICTDTPNGTFANHHAIEMAKRPEYSQERLLFGCCVGSQPMWRKSLHTELGYFDDTLTCAGDWDFWLRISSKYKFKHIPKFLGLYYYNEDGIEHGKKIHSLYERYVVGKRYGNPYISVIPLYTSKNNPLVSVIMPAYNAAEHIAEAIESVLIQNYRNFELIVVDDGSTDDTKDIVTSFKDDKIKYFYKDNGGPSSARNLGISKAKGHYIMPLDADDMMTPDFIAKHLAEFEKHADVDLVYCDVLLIGENSNPIRIMNKPEYHDRRYLIRDLLRAGHPVVPFRLGIRRSVFDRIGFYDEDLLIGEDYDMMRRFVKAGLKAHHLNETLHLRRMHADSLSGNCSAQKAKCHFDVIKRYIDTFAYNELFPDVAWDEIAPQMRQLHAKRLVAGTYLTIGQNYVRTKAIECSRIAFDLACSELNDCVKMDSENQGLRQLSQKFKLIRAKYTEAPQQVVS